MAFFICRSWAILLPLHGKVGKMVKIMKGDNLTSVYFVGIGGVGMSAIARYFISRGYNVAGYDKASSIITQELEHEGIRVIFEDSVEAIPEPFLDKDHTLIVKTPAVPATHPQLLYFEQQGYIIKKRSQVLGDITRSMQALCVAGTHGKTTTSTILAHLLYQSDINTNAFLGGISNNYGTNLLLSKESNYVVAEADEFDRSFLQLSPYMAVITSVDPDHLDIYGDAAGFKEGFEQFSALVRKGGALLVKHGIDFEPKVQTGVKVYTYYGVNENVSGCGSTPNFYAENVVVKQGNIYFDFVTPQSRIANLKLGVPIWVNIENSVAAMAIAWLNGVTESELRLGLASYKGVLRRFNIHVNNSHFAYIDDYAHHPTEIKSSLESIRRLYANAHLTIIFQPHLYSRTKDFADGFVNALNNADEVILLPIYPAREEPIEGVSSDMLAEKISVPCRVLSKEQLLEDMCARVSTDGEFEVIATLGAGDIDRLVPQISKILK